MSDVWSQEAELRELPGDPSVETDFAYWIESLGSWIAADEEEAATIRQAAGIDAKITLSAHLP